MRTAAATPLALVTALVIASPGLAAASTGSPETAEEQPVGSTTLASPGFTISEVLIEAPDTSNGGAVTTFIANSLGGPSQVYLHRQGAAQSELVSRTADGGGASGDSDQAAVAPDGTFVVYSSWADEIGPGNPFGDRQIYLYNTATRTNLLISRTSSGALGNGDSVAPSVSPDSRFVTYQSDARNLTPDGEYGLGLFLYEVATGRTRALDAGTGPVDGREPVVSAGGRYVAFTSGTDLLPADTNGNADVYRYDGRNRTIALVSRGRGAERFDGAKSTGPQISADGQRICYTSSATNLVPGDPGTRPDIFLADATTRTTQLVSRDVSGDWPNGPSYSCDISADGRLVAYDSAASDLVPSDPNGWRDVFVRDTVTGTTELVSRGSDGEPGDEASGDPALSADGRYVAFRSYASNLAPEDTDSQADAFLHRLS